jgi:uncharacterized protein
MSENDIPRPTVPISPDSKPFWEALAQSRIRVQQCANCRSLFHYPRHRCPRCWSTDLEWTLASGRAQLRSYTVIHRPGHPAWTRDVPYIVGLVELEEGPCLLTNIIDATPQELRIGLPLVASFVSEGEATLLKFAPGSTRR